MPSLLALGFGYSAAPVVHALRQEGWSVTATTRSAQKAAAMEATGVSPVVWQAPAPLPSAAVKGADVILTSLSPDAEGCPAARAVREEGVREGATLIYLSSSGVYGDFNGNWVDEDTVPRPSGARGERRLVAEEAWRAIGEAAGARVHLMRLSGIYGPGRNAVESLLGDTAGARSGLGQRIIKPGQVFNRIHRDDICGAVLAVLKAPAAPQVLNVADGHPSPPQDVIAYAADLLGVAPPPEVPFEDAEMSDMAREFYADNKRLRVDRLLSVPGFSLRFPTYQEGLRAILRDLPAAPGRL